MTGMRDEVAFLFGLFDDAQSDAVFPVSQVWAVSVFSCHLLEMTPFFHYAHRATGVQELMQREIRRRSAVARRKQRTSALP